jgi:hypothetical protein
MAWNECRMRRGSSWTTFLAIIVQLVVHPSRILRAGAFLPLAGRRYPTDSPGVVIVAGSSYTTPQQCREQNTLQLAIAHQNSHVEIMHCCLLRVVTKDTTA